MTTLLNDSVLWSSAEVIDRGAPAEHTAVSHRRWPQAVEHIQTSAAQPVVVALDVAVAAIVAAGLQRSAGAVAASLLLVAVAATTGLYHRRSTIESQGTLWYLKALALPLGVTAAILAFTRPAGLSRDAAIVDLTVTAALLVAIRLGLWLATARARRQGYGLRRALVVGPTTALEQVVRRVEAFPECGLKVVAVDADVNGCNGAIQMVAQRSVDEVLVIGPVGDTTGCEELLHAGDGSGIDYHTILPLPGSAIPLRPRIADMRIVALGRVSYAGGRRPLKRGFDIAVSALTLLVLAPAFAIIAVAIKLGSPGPVFFGQTRVGKGGRTFKIWKFRSMVDGAANMMQDHIDLNVSNGLLIKLANDPRITRVGKWLRRLSLDELPQFFNVLKGDMSLVGPRPLAVDPDEFDDVANKRHSVRPGITGPWQVHGSHALSYEDMVKLDLAYIKDWSFRRDLWLLLLTPTALLVRRAPAI